MTVHRCPGESARKRSAIPCWRPWLAVPDCTRSSGPTRWTLCRRHPRPVQSPRTAQTARRRTLRHRKARRRVTRRTRPLKPCERCCEGRRPNGRPGISGVVRQLQGHAGRPAVSELMDCSDYLELLPELADFLRGAADHLDRLFTEAMDSELSSGPWRTTRTVDRKPAKRRWALWSIGLPGTRHIVFRMPGYYLQWTFTAIRVATNNTGGD